MPYNVGYVSGEWYQTFIFENKLQCDSWNNQVMHIKTVAAKQINREDEQETKLHWKKWLKIVERFVAQWSEDYLPPDVKHAVNDVQQGISEPATNWREPPELFRRSFS